VRKNVDGNKNIEEKENNFMSETRTKRQLLETMEKLTGRMRKTKSRKKKL